MRLTTVSDAEAVAARAADRCAMVVARAIEERGVAHVALSGGSTPQRTHELLAERSDIDWSAVEVWFSDERCVPGDHADSNFRAADEALLSKVSPRAVHRCRGELGPDEGAAAYASELVDAVGAEPVLDLVFCGMGPDGHTCSLFPSFAQVDEEAFEVLGVTGSPKPPPERITFAFPLLWRARLTLLLVAGAAKADAFAAVCAGADPRVPASLLRRGRLEAIADDAAAPPPLARPG